MTQLINVAEGHGVGRVHEAVQVGVELEDPSVVDPDPLPDGATARRLAARALAGSGDPAVRPLLKRLRQADDEAVRRLAESGLELRAR